MKPSFFLFIISLFVASQADAQAITGVWRGKLSRGLKNYNLELKLVRNGDSLAGTSYYYHSSSNYSRFKVKGYFDISGDIIWWDEEMIESKGGRFSSPNSTAFRFAADFNCPGNEIMMLDGTANKKEDSDKDHEVHLSKTREPFFNDEWDEVIDDFPFYAAEPGLIDSIQNQTVAKKEPPKPEPPKSQPPAAKTTTTKPKTTVPVVITKEPEVPLVLQKPKTIEEKFKERKKILVTKIPVSGDSITLAFYDHAEVDGDSITLFLNGKLIHQHVLLKASAYEFKIAVADLEDENELTMVAENLGSIPPNTSLMVVWVNGVRFEARLESSENTSATVQFTKKATDLPQGTGKL